jgi:hypothetical protein
MARNAPTNDLLLEEENPSRTPSAQKGSAATSLLIAGGLMLVLAGVALVAVPMAPKPWSSVAAIAEKHGITGLPIALAGVVLCGLWIAARSRREAPGTTNEQPDQSLILEQVASDLSQMRGGIQDLRVEFVYLKDQVLKIPSQLQLTQDSSGENSQAAVFHLAASVDQLSGRMEHLLRTQETAIQSRIGSLEQSVRASQMQVASMQQRLESATAKAWLGDRDEEPQPEYEAAAEPEVEIEEGYRAGVDDVDVWVEMEEPAPMDLGLLDRLDDSGTPHGPKTSPAITPSIARETDRIDLFEHTPANSGRNPKAPLPSQLALRARSNGAQSEIEAKLDMLRELMSDPRVREAVTSQRREKSH